MKILIAHNRYQQPGGEDQVVRAEAEMLQRYGHTVQELAFDNEAIQGTAAQLRAAANSFFSAASYDRVQKQMQTFRPDVLHVHNFLPTLSPAVFFAARKAGVPVVQTLHNFRLVCANGVLYRDGKPCEQCLESHSFLPGVRNSCYRGSKLGSAVVGGTMALHTALGTWEQRVDRYIALTEFAAAKLGQSRLPANRIRVKPNFVPDRGIGEETGDYALFVGRLSAEKGIDVLLEADAAHSLQLPIVIVGDGPLRQRVDQACARPGSRLRAVGRQTSQQVLCWMKRAAVLLLPSTCYEGFPVSVVEALSVGLPVIASRHGGIPEIVEEGKCGYLHTPGSAEDLARALRDFASLPLHAHRSLRTEARARYLAHYSEPINHELLTAIYAEAIAASGEQAITAPPPPPSLAHLQTR